LSPTKTGRKTKREVVSVYRKETGRKRRSRTISIHISDVYPRVLPNRLPQHPLRQTVHTELREESTDKALLLLLRVRVVVSVFLLFVRRRLRRRPGSRFRDILFV